MLVRTGGVKFETGVKRLAALTENVIVSITGQFMKGFNGSATQVEAAGKNVGNSLSTSSHNDQLPRKPAFHLGGLLM